MDSNKELRSATSVVACGSQRWHTISNEPHTHRQQQHIQQSTYFTRKGNAITTTDLEMATCESILCHALGYGPLAWHIEFHINLYKILDVLQLKWWQPAITEDGYSNRETAHTTTKRKCAVWCTGNMCVCVCVPNSKLWLQLLNVEQRKCTQHRFCTTKANQSSMECSMHIAQAQGTLSCIMFVAVWTNLAADAAATANVSMRKMKQLMYILSPYPYVAISPQISLMDSEIGELVIIWIVESIHKQRSAVYIYVISFCFVIACGVFESNANCLIPFHFVLPSSNA